jgi:lipopolysaccharide export LptBFGC system permease protein LptF
MILVDQPNTLIVYSKRDNLRNANISSPRGRSRKSGSESQEGEGNVDDSPE